MTTAMLEQMPHSGTTDCRFPEWCYGSCKLDRQGAERNHWSSGIRFWAFDVDDERIAVELYGYENEEDGSNPVRVYLAAGDQNMDEDGTSLCTTEARALGEALQAFKPRAPQAEDDLVYSAPGVDGDWAVSAEYRRERYGRDGSCRDEHVEVSIRPDSTRQHSIRVRLSMDDAHALGRCLVGQAELADAANRFFGLVTS